MSGKYNGLQAHLKRKNPLIHYIPCAAHSLNLVGVNSIEACSPVVGQYFDLLQSLYTFTSASTHRWQTVFCDPNMPIDLTLKSLSSTRWSCRADSTKALRRNYHKIRDKISSFANDESEKRDTRAEAASLCAQLDSLEMCFMATFWDTILARFQATSIILQRRDVSLGTAVSALESLHDFVAAQRDRFDHFEQVALGEPGITRDYRQDTRRKKRRKTFADESRENATEFDGRDSFQIETFNVAIDMLTQCLRNRLDAYRHLRSLFDVLFCVTSGESDASVLEKAKTLADAYPSDLNDQLGDEFIQLRTYVKPEDDTSPQGLMHMITNCGLQPMFPNVHIALRIFLTLPVTNCEGERSFSLLARVKNELRTSMKQKRLKALSLMAIESELTKSLDFSDIVDTFSRSKSRKKLM